MTRYLIIAVLLVLAACTQTVDTTTTPEIDDPIDPDQSNPVDAANLPGAPGPHEVRTAAVPYFDGATGFKARPSAAGEYPGVVMIHEWWGLNENIRDSAELLASHGYHVLAVDLYDGEVAETSDEARELVSSFDSERGVQNMEAAVDYLESQGSEQVASLGWCFGGGQSLELARNADLDATVVYYGSVENGLEGVDEPVLGIFGANDTSIPVSNVRDFESRLASMDVPHAVHVYEGAGHAFANPSGDRYVADAAEDAWGKTITFLSQELQQAAPPGDGDVVDVSVTGENFRFMVDGEENPTITVNEGDTVRITFESVQGFHDFVIDEFDAATTQVRPDDGSVTVEFVADQAGTFDYYCSVGSHRQNGMEGTFVVSAQD